MPACRNLPPSGFHFAKNVFSCTASVGTDILRRARRRSRLPGFFRTLRRGRHVRTRPAKPNVINDVIVGWALSSLPTLSSKLGENSPSSAADDCTAPDRMHFRTAFPLKSLWIRPTRKLAGLLCGTHACPKVAQTGTSALTPFEIKHGFVTCPDPQGL